jgi:hypothetical protein
MRELLLIAIGAVLLYLGSRQMVSTLNSGSVRIRGGRIINRNHQPVMFWLNFAGLIIVCILGGWLIVWALLGAH